MSKFIRHLACCHSPGIVQKLLARLPDRWRSQGLCPTSEHKDGLHCACWYIRIAPCCDCEGIPALGLVVEDEDDRVWSH